MSEKNNNKTCRFIPEDWLHPFDVQSLFERDAPLHVDVGFGKGRFLLERCKSHPDVNFLAIDRMLKRVRKADRKLLRQEIENVRLLRLEAYYAIAHLMPPDCVDSYYVFFPDPWPKDRHERHRLFNADFMDALHCTMKVGAQLHFATDHLPYFRLVYDLLSRDERFAACETFRPSDAERTDFELLFMAEKPIGRCSFIRS